MPLPQENRCTLADVLAWEEQERMELINGYPVMMAPPSRAHQGIVSQLNRQIGNYLQGKKCSVYPAPFAVRLCVIPPSWMTSAAGARRIW